jgi:hypothetical protein
MQQCYTPNSLVAKGRYEDISKHDLAILTDLVSDPVGTDNDEGGTILYLEFYFFSEKILLERNER